MPCEILPTHPVKDLFAHACAIGGDSLIFKKFLSDLRIGLSRLSWLRLWLSFSTFAFVTVSLQFLFQLTASIQFTLYGLVLSLLTGSFACFLSKALSGW
jgi:hypothetical protein